MAPHDSPGRTGLVGMDGGGGPHAADRVRRPHRRHAGGHAGGDRPRGSPPRQRRQSLHDLQGPMGRPAAIWAVSLGTVRSAHRPTCRSADAHAARQPGRPGHLCLGGDRLRSPRLPGRGRPLSRALDEHAASPGGATVLPYRAYAGLLAAAADLRLAASRGAVDRRCRGGGQPRGRPNDHGIAGAGFHDVPVASPSPHLGQSGGARSRHTDPLSAVPDRGPRRAVVRAATAAIRR